MGAWGYGIFDDDLTLDIRGTYRELLEAKVADDEATNRVIAAYRDLGPDEEHLLWLGLAAAQAEVGRLDAHVRSRALIVIDTKVDLQDWADQGAEAVANREAHLARLRADLTGHVEPPT